VGEAANRLVLTACIIELEALRFTPAGVPALNLKLEHASSVDEAGQSREVKAAVKAVALGAMAERLARQATGSIWRFSGFLANPRNGKHPVFHIQEFFARTITNFRTSTCQDQNVSTRTSAPSAQHKICCSSASAFAASP